MSRFFAGIYSRNAFDITPVELNGSPGAVLRADGMTHAITFAVADGLISGVFLVVNPYKAGGRPTHQVISAGPDQGGAWARRRRFVCCRAC